MKITQSTWSPFQSQEVREICEHMTGAERDEVARRGRHYGFWVAATFAGPLALAITSRSLALMVIAIVLVTIHIACIPAWQRKQKGFLCSTTWAQERGFTPDRLKLFAFRF